MTKYFVYDVFTDSRFGGNPLAIIPDASGLPEGDFQRIAREFNFSERLSFCRLTIPATPQKFGYFRPCQNCPLPVIQQSALRSRWPGRATGRI